MKSCDEEIRPNGPVATFWVVILFAVFAWLLSANLGRPGLFEPDEGRNAEIAREILLLKDWVTPHYDFLPRLDKPILYFDIVALSFLLFGASEWSARLPSAIAALACAGATYRLARTLHGRAAALWSALILVTGIEFFALSQIVILDMFLALFLTVGLSCFFRAAQAEEGAAKRQFLCMYAAFGVATLTKGPVGFVLPAMIITFYIVATRRWALLSRMELPLGITLFLALTAPWYLLAEIRNPGYLRHFWLRENLARFTTTAFHRTEPWYFYLFVLPAGFFPWTLLLPRTAGAWLRRPLTGEALFLGLWALTPLLFLSFSISKMAHYILPVFPPLSIMVGATIADGFRQSRPKAARAAIYAGGVYLALGGAVLAALTWPQLLPSLARAHATAGWRHVSVPAVASVLAALSLAFTTARSRMWRSPSGVYGTTLGGFALFLLLSPALTTPVAEHRSSKLLAAQASAHLEAADQLLLYGGYPSSLPFYLDLRRPIWVISSDEKRQILGSDYVALERPQPAPGHGQVLYRAEEIAAIWRQPDKRLVAFVRSNALGRFGRITGAPPHVLARIQDTVLITNRPPRQALPASAPGSSARDA